VTWTQVVPRSSSAATFRFSCDTGQRIVEIPVTGSAAVLLFFGFGFGFVVSVLLTVVYFAYRGRGATREAIKSPSSSVLRPRAVAESQFWAVHPLSLEYLI
jgi:hypothetical protein